MGAPNMFLVIVSALMTIFGIGVQVGLAAVLAGDSYASPACWAGSCSR